MKTRGKPIGNIHLRRLKRGWEENIGMYLKEILSIWEEIGRLSSLKGLLENSGFYKSYS